jgi:hypothetical protein
MKRCAPRAHPTAKRAREAVETASSSKSRKGQAFYAAAGASQKNQERFGSRRNNGAREMRNVDLRGLFTVRDLQNEAMRPSGASNG